MILFWGTSLFVTHDQVEAMTLAQRMLVMNAGRVEQMGTPEQVYGKPASSFVASFIGSPPMNLLTGSADGTRFTVQGLTLVLPAAAPRAGALVLGVRPEHVEIHPDGAWPMVVETIEMLGAERLVHGRLGGFGGFGGLGGLGGLGGFSNAPTAGSGGVASSALFTVRIDAMLVPPQVGQTVRLAAAPAHLHWFDAATGLRVGA